MNQTVYFNKQSQQYIEEHSEESVSSIVNRAIAGLGAADISKAPAKTATELNIPGVTTADKLDEPIYEEFDT